MKFSGVLSFLGINRGETNAIPSSLLGVPSGTGGGLYLASKPPHTFPGNSVIVTHPDGSKNTYVGYMAGVSNRPNGTDWKLSIIPDDPAKPALVIDLVPGDQYQTVGELPDPLTYADPSVIGRDVIPPGVIIKVPR